MLNSPVSEGVECYTAGPSSDARWLNAPGGQEMACDLTALSSSGLQVSFSDLGHQLNAYRRVPHDYVHRVILFLSQIPPLFPFPMVLLSYYEFSKSLC